MNYFSLGVGFRPKSFLPLKKKVITNEKKLKIAIVSIIDF